MNERTEITPLVRELDWKLRDIESGQLCTSEKNQVMESTCRTLRAYLRTEFGLEEEDHLSGFLKKGRQPCMKVAEFVRVVVLPHNEEGVLDSIEDINNWIAEEEKKAEEAKKKSDKS